MLPGRRRIARRLPVAAAVTVAATAILAFTWRYRPAQPALARAVRFIPLTSAPGNELEPALSASGTLTYVARAADGRSHLFIKRPGDPEAAQLTTGAGRETAPVWSPDEREVAFVRVDPSGCAIWIVDTVARAERRIGACLSHVATHMAWSPDGRFLAASADGARADASRYLELVEVASGAHYPVTDPPAGQLGDDSPAFSPDGRELAFLRSISGSIGDIYVAPSSGGAARRVTFDDGDIIGLDWEADGKHIVFSSERGGGISLWRVASAGGEPTFVAGGGAKLKHPSVARAIGATAFENWHYESI